MPPRFSAGRFSAWQISRSAVISSPSRPPEGRKNFNPLRFHGWWDAVICTDPSKYSDAYGDGYVLLPDVLALNGEGDSNYSRNGYIKREKFFREYPILQMPDDVTAGSETYEAAYAWQSKNGQRPFFGGSLSGGSGVLPRSRFCIYTFSSSYAHCGSRPLKR